MKIAIIAIARLENDYINEWIGHHLNIGVDHIYVYDNSSNEEEKLNGAVYEKFMNKVTIIPAYDEVQYQIPAYKDAYKKYGCLYDYLVYIDVDEFIFLQKDDSIKEFVVRFPKDCECYRMNWLIYGDNGIVNRDVTSSVVADFTKPLLRNKKNTTTKSIIKGGLEDIDFESVHYAIRNKNGKKTNLVTYYGDMKNITDELPIKSKSLNIGKKDYEFVKLNHYITKSISEFICQKMRRPDAAWNYERSIDKDFFCYNDKTSEKVELYKLSQKSLNYYYWSSKWKDGYDNAGDYYNKILMNKIYYCLCIPVNNKVDRMGTKVNIAFCGSVLESGYIKNADYIVGCGLQNSKQPVNRNENAYLSVRGKLTKKRLIDSGVNVGDVKFVDPGLMVSKIYNFCDVKKKYKIGIIPHSIDEPEVRQKYGDEYKIISMRTSDIQMVCRNIKECDIILSSSLHGIIFSHSLGVPAYHIEMKKLQEGDNFKFKDYYSCFDSNIHYETFKCDDFIIPIERILEYDRLHRYECNPSYDDILKKQKDFLSILPYKKFINQKFKLDTKSNINVCFTSFKGRINNLKPLIDSLLNQSVRCNIYLTLSIDEFPNKENELPKYLTSISDSRLHINWVEKNIKPFKKSLYTLHLLDDDAIIVTLDDDVVLNKDTIEIGLKHFDGNNPLCIKHYKTTVGYNKMMYTPSGCFTIYNKNMVKHWDEIINDEIILTNDDDRFMMALFWLNGYYNKPIFELSVNELIKGKGKEVLTQNLSMDECKKMALNSDEIISKYVKKITGKHLYDSFGYFNNEPVEETKIDIRKNSRINQLKEDIKNGNVIKTYSPNGSGFVWKRVK